MIAGAGVSGLLAAAALRHLGPVVLVEQDGADAWRADVRAGVPHGHQLHNLLGRAQRHLEELVPGALAAIAERGGVSGGVAKDTYVVEYGVAMPPRDLGLSIWSVTRRALEEALAELVFGPSVTRLVGRVVGVELDDGVCGALVETKDGTEPVGTRLVVDATGRRAAARGWLGDLGQPQPATTELSTREWYASVVVETTSPRAPFVMVFPTRATPFGGLVSPAGDGASRISLNGSVGAPPRTIDDFFDVARSLADPAIAAALKSASAGPRPEVRAFGAPRAAWHRYDEMAELPPGLLPVGDAVANLSPLFGQGVAGAAWEASGLRSAFATRADATDADARRQSTRSYLKHSGEVRRAQWNLMTIQEPGGPGDLDDAQVTTLVGRVAAEPSAHAAYVRMWHLLEPVGVLPALLRGDSIHEHAGGLVGGAA